jgi:RNAse (barnase) inhibitor barstar
MRRYELDGQNFSTLEEFFEEIGRLLVPDAEWGRNLDAFNDVLRGGFGTPEEGFELVWLHHEVSRERLGHVETVRQLEDTLARCHSSNREKVARRLEDARAGVGPTVFDWLIDIIRVHGPGGGEERDHVTLSLR